MHKLYLSFYHSCLSLQWTVDKKTREKLKQHCFATFFLSYLALKCYENVKYAPLAYPYTSLTSAIEKPGLLPDVKRAALDSHSWILLPLAYIFKVPQNDNLLKPYSFIHQIVVSYTTSVQYTGRHLEKNVTFKRWFLIKRNERAKNVYRGNQDALGWEHGKPSWQKRSLSFKSLSPTFEGMFVVFNWK